MACYYTPFCDPRTASRRATVQSICFIETKDIDEYGFSACVATLVEELRDLVVNGFTDEKSGQMYQVRLAGNLGDNLEQHQENIFSPGEFYQFL